MFKFTLRKRNKQVKAAEESDVKNTKDTTLPDDNADDDIEDDDIPEKPMNPKPKPIRLSFVLMGVFALSAGAVYLYLNGLFSEPLKPNLVSRELPTSAKPSVQPIQQTPPSQMQAQAQQQQQQQEQAQTVHSHSSSMSAQPAANSAPAIQSRQLYIPAKDILANAADLQSVKDRIEKLELELKAKKLEKDLLQVASEASVIPITTEASKVETAARIAEKKVKPVPVDAAQAKKALPPPSLVHIFNNYAVLQMPTGERVKIKAGDSIGDYTVNSIKNNGVVIIDKDGRQFEITMQLPDKYPVYPSMFGSKGGNMIAVTQPHSTANQPMPAGLPPVMPQQYVPIPVSKPNR